MFKKKLVSILSPIKPSLEFLSIPLYLVIRKPFSLGYSAYKWMLIKKSINDEALIYGFRENKIPENFGIKLDERVVEYPWLFAQFSQTAKTILDAGSTFNFKSILTNKYFVDKKLHIYTFCPEKKNFPSQNVSYEYGDLRSLPYQNCYFDQIICHSTLEHIDMDNSIYGYELSFNQNRTEKSYEYLKVISETQRVLKTDGTLLLTFPFGIFKNYGFFQQFDIEMVDRMKSYLHEYGTTELNFIKYSQWGWQFAKLEECINSTSFNPHTGEDKFSDGAAHSRSVCVLKFTKVSNK